MLDEDDDDGGIADGGGDCFSDGLPDNVVILYYIYRFLFWYITHNSIIILQYVDI